MEQPRSKRNTRRRPRQLLLFQEPPRTRRPKRGRPKKPGAGVRHARRAVVGGETTPVHVTLRVRRHVWNLRSRRSYRALERAFYAGHDRFGARLCHFSIQGNHLHFVVEANDRRALSRGMQGLAIRMARALNRLMGRKGKVFADRYHAHLLRSLPEVRAALRYVIQNHAHHAKAWGATVPPVDEFSSLMLPPWRALDGPLIARPRGWPLRIATRELRRALGVQ